MNDKARNNRTTRLNVRLHADMMCKLDSLAIEMGLASSTLGAVAIAEFVNSKIRIKEVAERTAELSANQLGGVVESLMANPEMIKLIASSDSDSVSENG